MSDLPRMMERICYLLSNTYVIASLWLRSSRQQIELLDRHQSMAPTV
ncbi:MULTISPECIES: hypothetical protein [unclassified Microcoleus]